MENILLKYMIERFDIDKERQSTWQENLPFITISREYGCPAKEIAEQICNKLNHRQHKKNIKSWNKISKEILHAAAEELHVDLERIKKIYNDENRGTIDEILNALSEKYYKSDRKILKTIDKIVLDFAKKGNVVIIGRGAIALTRSLSKGFHVRLFAPIEWRINRLIEKGYCKTIEEARSVSQKIDYKRNEFLKAKTKNDFFMYDFDVFFNCKYLSEDDIAETIIHMMKQKKLI